MIVVIVPGVPNSVGLVSGLIQLDSVQLCSFYIITNVHELTKFICLFIYLVLLYGVRHLISAVSQNVPLLLMHTHKLMMSSSTITLQVTS